MSREIMEIMEVLRSLTLTPGPSSPPIFYRKPTWYDRGGWTWNYTTGSPQGRVDFSNKRWLHLLGGWVIDGHTVRREMT